MESFDLSRPRTEVPREQELSGLLVEALRQLGAAGRAHEANEIAAKAWWLLEHGDERARSRINGVMHHLARLPLDGPGDEPHVGAPTAGQLTDPVPHAEERP